MFVASSAQDKQYLDVDWSVTNLIDDRQPALSSHLAASPSRGVVRSSRQSHYRAQMSNTRVRLSLHAKHTGLNES